MPQQQERAPVAALFALFGLPPVDEALLERHLVSRLANGLRIEKSWHMLAEADDGPMIPSMAAESIIRAWLDGKLPAPGARPATSEVSLADYDIVFGGRAIHYGQRIDNVVTSYKK